MSKLLIGFLLGYLTYASLEVYDYWEFANNINSDNGKLFSAIHDNLLWKPGWGADLIRKRRGRK